jgi:hypothetical protein
MTRLRTPSSISRLLTPGRWCVETTTASTRRGLPYAYSIVTWDLPSGSSQGSSPDFRTAASRRVSRCASEMVSGISSGVSVQAKPIIMPWSPAPWCSNGSPSSLARTSSDRSTPAAMSGDCSLRYTLISAWSGSKPVSGLTYPMPRSVSLIVCSMATSAWVVTSPMTQRKSLVTAVSHATRASGSWSRIASRIASETWSQTLSGWPSVTDSEVSR